MQMLRKRAGSTDVSVVLRIIDAGDGTPETGVAYNTSGIDLKYRREGAASVDITEATLAALTTAHTDGGFLHIGNGYYRLDLPDAAVGTGAAGVLIHGTVTGMVVIGAYIELDPVPADVRQFGGTDGTFSGGRPEVNTTHAAGTAWNSGAITAATLATDALGAAELAADAVTEVANAVWDVAARTLTALDEDTTTLDLDATIRSALGMSSANMDTQLDALPTNAELTARTLAAADYATAANLSTVDTVVDAIKLSTDNLPSDPADQSLIIAATNSILTDVGAVKADTAAILLDTGTDGVVVASASKTGYRLSATGVDDILDETVETGATLRESLRISNSALAGKASGLETTGVAFRNLADTKDVLVATVDADGNRAAVTVDAT